MIDPEVMGWTPVVLTRSKSPDLFNPSGFIALAVMDWLETTISTMCINYRGSRKALATDQSWLYRCPDSDTRFNSNINIFIRAIYDSVYYRHQFWFKDPAMATLFKLTWGGNV